jgi:hypothetical protein
MLNRLGWIILTLLFCAQGFAQQVGHLYLSPIYPEYSSMDKKQIEVMDSSLQRELVQFSDRRARAQSAQFAYTSKDAGSVQSDSFVLKRILDRSVTRFTKSDFFTKSFLGHTAQTIKDKTQTDMQLSRPGEQSHKFDFKLALFQKQAFIQYEGYTKAQLRYDVRNGGSLALVYQKDLSPTSSLGLENTFTGNMRGQQLTLNFIW